MSQSFHGNGHPYNHHLPHLSAFDGLPDPSTTSHPILPSILSDATRARPPQPSALFEPAASHSLLNPSLQSFATSRQHPTSAPPNIHLPQIKPSADRPVLAMKKDPYVSTPPAQKSPPTHVVGSQGRRGILPSATGRPSAVNNPSANGGKLSPQLVKDAEGKYPCPHCSKPYLHAKHLKRHMLRHTGVRPYECALCHDTFSRSDILKRHFQKCSVRRGNPTGENHLAYSRANKHKAKQQEEEMSESMPQYTASLDSPINLAAMDLPYHDRHEPLANAVRAHELNRKYNANRASTSSSQFEFPGVATPDSVITSGAATPYTYHDSRSNINSPGEANFNMMRSYNGQSNGSLPHIVSRNHLEGEIDWSHPLLSSAEDYPIYHSGTSTPHHHSYKANHVDDINGFDFGFSAQTKS